MPNVIHEYLEQSKLGRGARSPSMAMAGIYEKDRSSIQEYVSHFSQIDSQVGAIFMINGKIAGLDSFGKPDSFSRVFKKLADSYALDAIDWFDPEKEHKALKSAVTDFMKAAQAAKIENHPSVGLGSDLRLESKKVTGFALSLDDQILHLCIFNRSNGQGRRNYPSAMERYSQRRRKNVY